MNEKTRDALALLKGVECEMLRLANALDRTNLTIDALQEKRGNREWKGLTEFDYQMLDVNNSTLFIEKEDQEKNVTYVGKQVNVTTLLRQAEKILKERNYE